MVVEIRKIKESDRNFVIATWLDNYRRSSSFAKRISNEIYYGNHNPIVLDILSKPTTEVLIACTPGDEDHCLGHIVFERFPDTVVVHYVFVKIEFQGLGIGAELFNFAKINRDSFTHTHMTYASAEIMAHKRYKASYNPYRLG